MAAPLTVRSARGRLATWDADTLGVLIVDETGADAAASTMVYVSDVAADELTAGGYARGTVDVVFDQDGETGRLMLDPLGTPYSTDTTGESPAGVWFYDTTGGADASRELIAFLPCAVGAGFAGWEPEPPDGIIATVAVVDDVLIAAVLAAIVEIDGGAA